MEKELQWLHHCLIIGCIVTCNPSNLLNDLNIYIVSRRVISCTFDVTLRQSVIKRKQWLRCSPVCLPGNLWNPIRSALRWSFFLSPADVFSSIDSIQWAVTAIKDVWLGLDHASVVNDIFPTDFWNLISMFTIETTWFTNRHFCLKHL